MEKKDVASNKNDADHTVEKIAYKIIPVPYYYPVPVDPEWYYENHERLSRQSERLFGFPEPHLEHFRPSFSRPRVREEYSLPEDRYESRERYRKSPLCRGNHVSNREYEREYDRRPMDEEEKQIPVVKSSESFKDGRASKKAQRSSNGDMDDMDDSSDDCLSEKAGNENGKHKRKHFLMSFPYDQKENESKTLEIETPVVDDTQQSSPQELKPTVDASNIEEQDEVKSETKKKFIESAKDSDRSQKPKYIYDGAHQPVIPSNVPYVVLKSTHPHDLVRDSRYSIRDIDSPRYEPPYTHYSNSRASLEDSNEDMDKEMRYHSNGRRARTVFTRKQLMTLNNVFEKHPFVSGEKMSELSDQLGLDRKIVKIWFQNKRQYARKKGSLVEREDDYYYNYSHVFTSGTPTMAEKWKNGN